MLFRSGFIGEHYERTDEYDLALESYQEALSLVEQEGDEQQQAWCLWDIGNIHWLKWDYEQAKQKYEEALDICGDDEAFQSIKSRCLDSLGHVYQLTGDLTSALDLFTKAMEILDVIGDVNGRILCLWSIGLVHLKQGQYDKATTDFNQCIDLSTQHHLLHRKADALLSLGRVAYEQKAHEKASSLFDQSWDSMVVCNHNVDKAVCRWYQAKFAEQIGDKQGAIELYREAKKWYDKFGQRDAVVACNQEIERLCAVATE